MGFGWFGFCCVRRVFLEGKVCFVKVVKIDWEWVGVRWELGFGGVENGVEVGSGERVFYYLEVVVDGVSDEFVGCDEGLGDEEGEFGVSFGEWDWVGFEGGSEGDEEGWVVFWEDGGGLVYFGDMLVMVINGIRWWWIYLFELILIVCLFIIVSLVNLVLFIVFLLLVIMIVRVFEFINVVLEFKLLFVGIVLFIKICMFFGLKLLLCFLCSSFKVFLRLDLK